MSTNTVDPFDKINAHFDNCVSSNGVVKFGEQQDSPINESQKEFTRMIDRTKVAIGTNEGKPAPWCLRMTELEYQYGLHGRRKQKI